jgi:hypothetical protein
LIPSSQESWRTACLALKEDTGGILHIHHNLQVTSFFLDSASQPLFNSLSGSAADFFYINGFEIARFP